MRHHRTPAANTYSDYARPGPKVYAATGPVDFLDYAELEFLRAEAVERGFNVGGTAAEHYANAIKSSIVYWGGTNAEADLYLANPQVAYATATGGWKQKIGFQKWIALYNRPYDGWLEVRRLDFPKLTLPVNAFSGFPNRFRYPSNEQLVNKANYTSAASKIGGDEVESKLWFDKF
ncbi:SusD/RagB family nutrient-binding outer membrane lipoprotein [Niabella sp. CC-SYL272]|uniref:SusD/RagB family nutrient-binding outer membrane lipoprotein n=1 Tax=Niabella agricola TaxID=2891571 RepID=UPI001F481F51|nr:SusD/RagB family nutrient-binding outer membrane lipoprotein [Niabella agricola]MCF3111865.1 SusD/RagB family nutrient-binding outer membrane lipoprotein [Niabella agricola]